MSMLQTNELSKPLTASFLDCYSMGNGELKHELVSSASGDSGIHDEYNSDSEIDSDVVLEIQSSSDNQNINDEEISDAPFNAIANNAANQSANSEKQRISADRLKAFNLFVRLLIDDNLDRAVPISKQPKNKIQAIISACDNRFPEFHERARVRIRTYLKSCRRTIRNRVAAGSSLEKYQSKPREEQQVKAARVQRMDAVLQVNGGAATEINSLFPPPTITATANAALKKMKLEADAEKKSPSPSTPINGKRPHSRQSPSSPLSAPLATPLDLNSLALMQQLQHSPALFPGLGSGLDSIFRTPFPTGYPGLGLANQASLAHLFNQPTQQSSSLNGSLEEPPSKKSAQSPLVNGEVLSSPTSSISSANGNTTNTTSASKASAAPVSSPIASSSSTAKLGSNESSAIKNLIKSYRESAAFLNRSADELEKLLQTSANN